MSGVTLRAAADRAALMLFGDVGYEITAGGVAAALKQAGGAPITVQIHSYGGDAAAGIAIHNMLARYPGKKKVVVEGLAASAASLIAMAGDEIVMPDNAFLMIHNAWGGVMGEADDMRSQAEVLDMITASYRDTYAARSGKSPEEVAEMMAATTWFTAEAALASGFATEVAPPTEIRADAGRLARLDKVPSALSALAALPTPTTPPAAPASTATEEVRVTDSPNTAAPQAAAPVNVAPVTGAVPNAVPTSPAVATLAELQAIAARAKLGNDFVVAQLAKLATVADATAAALDEIVAAAPAPVQAIHVTADEGDRFRARASSAIATRMTGGQPADDEREIMNMGLLGVAREILAARGERNVHRLSAEQVAERVLMNGTHTTGDFAGILTNSTNKSLRTMFGALPNTWSAWCDEFDVADFKTITAASIGQFPEPRTMEEAGQVPGGTVGEEFETYAVQERGVLVQLSYQAIVNDDLRAFQRVIQSASLGAYTALRRRVFGLLTANGNMRDGVALFATARGNLGTAGNLGATQLRELYQLLATQQTPTRAQPAATGGLSAPYLPAPTSLALLLPPTEYITALELLGNMLQPTAVGAALPAEFRNMITPVQEAFLETGNRPYYLARTEAGMRPFEIAYLQGRRAPTVTSAERIETTGITYRVKFDFEAAPVQARSIAANLG